jgi:ATP/maltotriose-dependent transcriptional regulator MalT
VRMTMLVEEAEAIARRLGDARALAFALLGRVQVRLDRVEKPDAFVATADEMAQLGEAIGERGVVCSSMICRLCGHLLAGDMAAADRQIETYALLAEETRQPFYLFWTPTFRALRALVDGRFADAERSIADAVTVVPRAHLAHWTQWYAPNVFALRREQGHLDDADQALRKAIADDPDAELTYPAMLALVLLEMGRDDEARHVFEDLAADDFARALRSRRWGTNFLHGLGYLAEVCAGLADAPRAARLYDLLAPHAGKILVYGGTWHVAGSAAYYLGLLADSLDRWDDADRHFGDALAANSRMGARPFVARTQFAYAAMLTRRDGPGDRARARSLTDAALTTANVLGMERLAVKVAALRATLEPSQAEDATSTTIRAGLTEREWEVLRLLVAGRSNPEIAEALFVSPATARTHVSNIFAKLGVHSRTEAVDYAHRNGLLISPNPPST